MNRKGIGFLCLLSVFYIGAFAQMNDAGLWVSGNIEKSFNQRLTLQFSEELRLMENISEASTIFSDLGLEYKINKHFRVAGHYRFINDRRLDDSYSHSSRFYIDASYRQKVKWLQCILRQRFQSQYEPFNSTAKVNPEMISRTKLTLRFDVSKRITPYAYGELFHPLNTNSLFFAEKMRYCAGLEYKINARHGVDLNYMIQHTYHSVPSNDFIIGLGYLLSL